MANKILTGGECPQGILDVVEGMIGYLADSSGYTAIEYAALRVLSNLFFAFIEEVGSSAMILAEGTGRTAILPSDVIISLAEMGFNLSLLNDLFIIRHLKAFREPAPIGNTSGSNVTPARGCVVSKAGVVGPTGSTIVPRSLTLRSDWQQGSAGSRATSSGLPILPTAHCPSHLQLPELPEPHTFMQTLVKRPPVAPDPAALRRRLVEQRRRLQHSLIRFLARIHPMHYLFPGDSELFLLAMPKADPRPYLSALLSDSMHSGGENRNQTSVTSAGLGVNESLDESANRGLRRSSANNSNTATASTDMGVSCSGGGGGAGGARSGGSNLYLMKPKFPEYGC